MDPEALPPCPACGSAHTYADVALLICPECAHEWSLEAAGDAGSSDAVIRDAVGNALADGDTVTVIKDLKVKGSASVVKVGTKVKGIRLLPGANDGHDIDCKVDGIGPMKLKSEFVRKA